MIVTVGPFGFLNIVYTKEARFGIITAVLAGLGRALAEVGAILIVGGNIARTGSVGGIGGDFLKPEHSRTLCEYPG